MKMMKSFTRVRSFLPVLLALAVAVAFPAARAAQAQDSAPPEYIQQYNAALEKAKQGSELQNQGDLAGAVEQYEAAYTQLADVVELAQEAGSVENANKAQKLSAQIAFRAGSLLHNDGQSEAAITHFEFGQEVAPATYTRNTQGLEAARNSLEQGPIVEASQALSSGNPRRTIELLSGLEEQTGNSYFYQALAYDQLGDTQNALAHSQRALDAGDIGSSKQGQLYLIVGESHMGNGDDEAAQQALEQAASVGSPQVKNRAEALLEQL